MAKLSFTTLSTLIDLYYPGVTNSRKELSANLALYRMSREMGSLVRDVFTTLPDETTGTVAITQGAAAVTGTGTSFDTGSDQYLNGLMQIDGDVTWYPVIAIGSSTGITLGASWAGTTVTAATFILVQPFYTLATATGDIVKMSIPGEEPLQRRTTEHFDEVLHNPAPGRPEFYILYEYDDASASGTVQVQLVEPPDNYYSITYYYRRRPTLFASASASETSDFPEQFNDAILYGTMEQIFLQQDDAERAGDYRVRFEAALRQTKGRQFAGITRQFGVSQVGRRGLLRDTTPYLGP